jgi:hypothetical protein
VDDLDDRLAEFEDRGISVGSIDTAAGVVRKAVIIAMRFQRGGLVANRATPPGRGSCSALGTDDIVRATRTTAPRVRAW